MQAIIYQINICLTLLLHLVKTVTTGIFFLFRTDQPLLFSISTALKSTSSPCFRPPPLFLSGARFSVLAIAVAASCTSQESDLKTYAILNLSSSDAFP